MSSRFKVPHKTQLRTIDDLRGYQYVDPPEGYRGANNWISWHGYGVEVGSGYGPHMLNEYARAKSEIEACITAVTGQGGKGKTYFVLRLAQILDPKFDVELQVPFGVDELLRLIDENTPLRRGQVICIDESQFSMSARDWAGEVQRELMKHLEAIRSRGFIIFIVALSEKVLDVIARNYVITHKLHLTRRGHAKFYKYQLGPFSQQPYPTKISDDTHMELPDVEYCGAPSCLKCRHSGLGREVWKRRERWDELQLPICYTLRARYERKKKAYLMGKLSETTQKNTEKTAPFGENDIYKIGLEHPDRLKKTTKNRIKAVYLRELVKAETGRDVPMQWVENASSRLNIEEEFIARVPSMSKGGG